MEEREWEGEEREEREERKGEARKGEGGESKHIFISTNKIKPHSQTTLAWE